MFKRMPEKGRSDYLDRKQIVGFGVRYAPRTGAFLVPMSNVRDEIVGALEMLRDCPNREEFPTIYHLDVAAMCVAQPAQRLRHPRDAALTQLYAAVGPSLKAKKVTGMYYHPIARLTDPDAHAQGERGKKLRKHLWTLTEEVIEAH